MSEKIAEKEKSANSGPVASDQEQNLAQSALADFTKQHYSSCLTHLHKLETTWRQDYKVAHNKTVAEYYLSGLKNTDQFQKSLQAVRQQACYVGDECVGLDDVDHCALYYNHAVLLFHLRKYNLALSIIKQVFTFIEPMEESLAHKVCLLLLELLICLRRVGEALEYVGYIITQFASTKNIQMLEEPTEKKPVVFDAATDAFRQKLLQYQTRCYLLYNYTSGAIRELKSIEASGGFEKTSTLFLSAHTEYLLNHCDRALDLLAAGQKMKRGGVKDCGESTALLFYNNMGCLHDRTGKPHLAAFYFRRALKENEECEKQFENGDGSDPVSNRPLFTLGGTRTAQLMYNLGVSQLFAGNPQQGFDCLLQAVQVFHMNPRLWLRMAECCIMTHKTSNEDEFLTNTRQLDCVLKIIGSGIHRKIVLKSSESKTGVGGVGEQSYAIPAPTLEFASLCLKNALLLLPAGVKGERRDTWVSPPHTPTAANKENKSSRSSMFGAPSSLMSDSEVQALRVSTLTANSYVALCLGDYTPALAWAEQLLREPRVPGAQRTLAHLYAAEALIFMDRINEALEHLNPDHVIDLETAIPQPGQEESDFRSKRNWHPESALTGKAVMQYNMAAALAMRGDYLKAGEILKYVWSLKTKAAIPVHIVMLAVYCELQLGHHDNAKSIIKQHGRISS